MCRASSTSHKVRMPECCAATFCVVTQATMQHSDPQIQDLLYLRQLFYGKLGQLARERTALLSHMTCYKIDESHISDKVTQLTHWSEQLRENAAEEHQSYKQFSSAFYRGVRLSFHCKPCMLLLLSSEPVRQQVTLCMLLCMSM